ncbi:MAG: alanyl-tRNA editing protein [Pseudomonadota bacterium]
MTKYLFQDDAYQKVCSAVVIQAQDNQVQLDQTIFYPLGGGQPGDTGTMTLETGESHQVVDTRKDRDSGAVIHYLEEGATVSVGTKVQLELNWLRRYKHMRMHTCLHLLGAVIPHGVTGGNISETKSRLDFDMQDGVDKETATAKLNELIQSSTALECQWISGTELAAQPELIRTLSVKPPMDADEIRLLRIPGIDLQPCGGTHVRNTAEIGKAVVSKVEKKGKHNRRVYVQLPEGV